VHPLSHGTKHSRCCPSNAPATASALSAPGLSGTSALRGRHAAFSATSPSDDVPLRSPNRDGVTMKVGTAIDNDTENVFEKRGAGRPGRPGPAGSQAVCGPHSCFSTHSERTDRICIRTCKRYVTVHALLDDGPRIRWPQISSRPRRRAPRAVLGSTCSAEYEEVFQLVWCCHHDERDH
jgi:hypothetical protein